MTKENVKENIKYAITDLTAGTVSGAIFAGIGAGVLGGLGYIFSHGDTETALYAAKWGAGVSGVIGGIRGALYSRKIRNDPWFSPYI